MNDNATGQAAPLPDMSRHTLSVEEAASLFADAGIPKSIRTVQRYCHNGILESIRTDTELGDKYLIDRVSVDHRIEELKKFQQMMAATRLDTSRHDASRHDTTRNDATRRDNADEYDTPRIKELEGEIFHLRIDNRAKEIVINQLVDERKGFLGQITKQATRIGELGTKLLQLTSPASPVKPTGPETPENLREASGAEVPEGDNHPEEFGL
jgi:hypothetical protein